MDKYDPDFYLEIIRESGELFKDQVVSDSKSKMLKEPLNNDDSISPKNLLSDSKDKELEEDYEEIKNEVITLLRRKIDRM